MNESEALSFRRASIDTGRGSEAVPVVPRTQRFRPGISVIADRAAAMAKRPAS
jgi:hypothetical protein